MNNALELKDAETLYYEPIRRSKMIVGGLLSTGLTILSGAPKIGKSFLMLEWCIAISKGEPIWGRKTEKTGVLYLSLEDTDLRLQERMHMITDSPPDNLFFVSICRKMGGGLLPEMVETIEEHPDVGLIVIDTLQKIRSEVQGNVNAYANDYDELSKLKLLADRLDIAVMVVHHTRKQKDTKDPFNEVSGSTGITGTSDTIMVMRQDIRGSSRATLHIAGRDVEQQELVIEQEHMIWKLIESKDQSQIFHEQVPEFIFRVVDFIESRSEWEGTATDLLEAMWDKDTPVNMVGKYLARYAYDVLDEHGIKYMTHRTGSKRTLKLVKSGDSGDGNDSRSVAEDKPSYLSQASSFIHNDRWNELS